MQTSPVTGDGQLQVSFPGVTSVPGQRHCLLRVPAAQLGAAASDGNVLPKGAAVAQRELHSWNTCITGVPSSKKVAHNVNVQGWNDAAWKSFGRVHQTLLVMGAATYTGFWPQYCAKLCA
jgi:hypothetical protein